MITAPGPRPVPASLRALLDDAVAAGVFPGGVLLVADAGQVVFEHAFGHRARVPAPGAPTTGDTVYDVASLTKPAATTAVAMRLVAEGRLGLDLPVVSLVPELAAAGPGHERVRVRHLLSHSAGMVWWRPFHERLLTGERLGAASARDAILRMTCAEPLEAEPGARSVYSDLGFILLGFALERAAGDRLDRLATHLVFEPLGMTAARFIDLAAKPAVTGPTPFAPTEICPRRGLLVGEVHDDNCHAAGGVLGHAGLFATAADLSRLCAALVAAWHGEPGALFVPEVVRAFFSPCGVAGSTWRHGWDGPSAGPGASQASDLWPKSGVGHMGFTGTSVWIDLERRRWVVLLTNRVHPSREDQRIKLVRPRVHEAIVRALG